MLEESINVYEDVFEICKNIRAQGIRTGILSNHASNWFAYLVKKYKLADVFDEKKLILVSQEIGIDKPGIADCFLK